eukprot:CAMPEP_0201659132 /NCGR_PEP_ID=MMETSP0494-20130426/1980_1 /ASSEMBLY_ACC=CAM_ASM_000839 /TAXON_ID=420259 /ORGANISM="Thalassiosira gravida, Strain GMp14c1" /LENGTH=668 /DNA_ID=CAMNT_0048136523 /DNA_START=218 /DNA_END=2221 /DNA_ORIENTATION=+
MKSAASAQERHDRLMNTDETDLENPPSTPKLRNDDVPWHNATHIVSAATATSHHDDGNATLAEAEEGQATMGDSHVASQYEEMDADLKAFVKMNNSIPTPMPPMPDSQIEYAAKSNDDFGENVKTKKKRRKKKKHHKRNNRKGSEEVNERESRDVSKSAFVNSYADTATAASQHHGDGTSATATIDSRHPTGNTVQQQKPSSTTISPQEVSPTVPQVSTHRPPSSQRGNNREPARSRPSQPQYHPPITSQASPIPQDPSSLSLSLSRIDEENKPLEVEATLVQSVEATLILNDNNQNNTVTDNRPVYVATRVSSMMSISIDGTRSWWKKYKAYIALGLGSLALGAMGATIGILVSDNGDARDHHDDISGSGGTTSVFLGGIGNITGPPSSSTIAPTTASPLGASTTATFSSPSPTTTLANETSTNPTMAELSETIIPPSIFPLPSPDESEGPTFRPPSTSAPTFKIDSTTSADPTHSPTEWVGSTTTPSVSPSTLKPTNQATTSISNEQTTTSATLSTFDIMAPGTWEFQISYGCVFNVRTKPNVNNGTVLLTGFDFYTQSTANVTYELWTRAGTFKGYRGNFEGWDLIANGTTVGRGVQGGSTPIPADTYTPVSITKGGNIRAFYLTLDTPELLYMLGDGVESDETAPETTVSDARFHAETDDLEVW